MKHQAVIDRIVDGAAVLLVGDDERELSVPLHLLPPAVEEGSWLLIDLEGDDLLSAELDPSTTSQSRARIEAKLERLRQRGRRS